MKILFDTVGFTLVHDTTHNWLYATWRGTHPGRSSVGDYQVILEQAGTTQSLKLLNDTSQDLDCWGSITEWIEHDFFQPLADAGVVAVAWVLPHNLRAQTDVNKVLAAVTRPMIDLFSDIESAHHWLLTLPVGQLD